MPDEEKSAAGSVFGRWFGQKTIPRAEFDEVWRGETQFKNTLQERVVKLWIVVPDEEKSAAGSVFGRWFGQKTIPKAGFDEVWRGETQFKNTLQERVLIAFYKSS